MIVHPWGFGFSGTPEEITDKLNSIGDMEGGFTQILRNHLVFLLNKNDANKKMKFHVAGHEGHFVMNLEEIPEEVSEEKKEETKNEG